jgi:Prenyltransferase and squalene oxidase repeat
VALIEAAQNADGGWPYEPGRSSWTEPSVFALLSSLGAGSPPGFVKRGVEWLVANQNSDGGWSPQPKTGPSTWVTALAAMLPATVIDEAVHQKCVKWLLEQTGQESNMVHRIRQWMLGNQDLSVGAEKGWPWYPGAAAWVMPTALSLLALRKEQAIHPADALTGRIHEGTQYLLLHTCKGGGWNHGSTHALGYESSPYPETTGVALLALRGVKAPEVDLGIAQAEKFIQEPNPAGAAWLRLGLMAQKRNVPALEAPVHPRKSNVVDEALYRLNANPDVLLA